MTPMRSRRLKLVLASVGLLMLIPFAAYREIENGITGIQNARSLLIVHPIVGSRSTFFQSLVKQAVESLDRASDAGLFTNPAEIANFNADPDLEALRSELSFVGFHQSVRP
jgi:hypothetical protein